MRRIVIIGLGLIGGSMGLALKQADPGETEVVGYTRSAETSTKAVKLGAVDRMETNIASAVYKADLVILATPPMVIKDILKEIGPHLSPGCVVTDAASTKVKVMEWAEWYLPETVNFVGGHPMAGKELPGIDVAEFSLFQECTYCIVPAESASPEATRVVVDLVTTLGANPLFIDAQEHDNLVAGISHLPLIISSALVMTTTQSPSWEKMSGLAAGGYRDLTRLASQHPMMNRDICFTNKDNVLDWIDKFTGELKQFRDLISREDNKLEKLFSRGQRARQKWIEERGKRG